MDNTCTEDAGVFHKILNEKIEEYLREAEILMKESYDEAAEADLSFFELNGKVLQSNIDEFDALTESEASGYSEEYDIYYKTLLNATTEGFLKGYLVARLGIQPGYNPYNWQYLGKKYVELMEKEKEEGQS